ncbi:MAG TPA: hypothetical protein VHQ43_07160 [Solirubrobacterales bacterium]|jgi:hypothetical protein|nr:hypothetical protein [Solirubrobacterales bacterium]
MRASFPTQFDAVILGKSREAGSFDTPDGEVKFGDAYELSFESSDGLTQTCRVALKQLDAAADFDVQKAGAFTAVQVVGDVQVSDKGGYLRLTSVRLHPSSDPANVAKKA